MKQVDVDVRVATTKKVSKRDILDAIGRGMQTIGLESSDYCAAVLPKGRKR